MSVLDEVRALEQRVRQRLRELGPLVAEYHDLEKVAERLGLKRDDDEATDTAGHGASEPSPKGKPAAKQRAKPAARRRAAKRASPGRPKAAVAAETKPKPAGGARPKAAAK